MFDMTKTLLKIIATLSILTMLMAMSSANAYTAQNKPTTNTDLFEDEEYVIYEPIEDEFQDFSTPFN
jgi:hypothetical protein